MQQLFIGGIRSGKSRLAEAAASATQHNVTYIATAQVLDGEMRARAEQHSARRPHHWQLLEEPIALANVIGKNDAKHHCFLIDCLPLWLSNLLLNEKISAQREIDKLIALLPTRQSDIIFVSGEVGLGVMPDNALARRYADELGALNQTIAHCCDKVTLAVAGLPCILKP